MVSLRDDGWAKARAGVTTVEEILRVTQEDT
jgi:type II secretory ATPase GspE/PulE/Tfp pilus assembly ATPase PilB-like protein